MRTKTNGKWSVQKLIYTGMLAALAGVLMSLEFSVPLMPPFYKVDFSDVPSIVAVFLMGPVSGICVEVIKILIKLITVGTNTMYVGEFSNLIGIILFVGPLWLVYKKRGANKRAAVEALLVSIPIRTAFACFTNAFITLPLYAQAMNLPLDQVITINILKIGLNSVVAHLLYSRLLAAKIVPKVV